MAGPDKPLGGVYQETATALCRKQNYPFDKQWEFTRTSLNKLQDDHIVDAIERNARDPIRKLGPEERIVGPLKLLWEKAMTPFL